MNTEKIITHFGILKKECHESYLLNIEMYHDLYNYNEERAELHYSIAMEMLTRIEVYNKMISDIQENNLLDNQVVRK
jgi:hypothetical protein